MNLVSGTTTARRLTLEPRRPVHLAGGVENAQGAQSGTAVVQRVSQPAVGGCRCPPTEGCIGIIILDLPGSASAVTDGTCGMVSPVAVR